MREKKALDVTKTLKTSALLRLLAVCGATLVVLIWNQIYKGKRAKYTSQRVARMTTLKERLLGDVQEEIKKLDELEKAAKERREKVLQEGVEQKLVLERCLQDDLLAKAGESRTDILCVVDRIKEFQKERKFFHLIQAIHDAINRISKHQEDFSLDALGENVFNPIKDGLDAHRASLQIIIKCGRGLLDIDKLNVHSSKRDLEKWAENLECLGEEMEDNLPFFSTEVFDGLENLCTAIVLTTRQKTTIGPKREEWRRRLRFAAGFILNLINSAREDAILEDEELLQDLLIMSQPTLGKAWEE